MQPARKMNPDTSLVSIQQFCKRNANHISDWLFKEHHCPTQDIPTVHEAIIVELKKSVPSEKNHSESYIWEVLTSISGKVLRKKKQLMSKNFGLSEASFQKMQRDMKQGDRNLFEKVFLANFEDCIQFLIRKYRIQRGDAYDVSMDTMLVFYHKLMDDKLYYGNLRFLFLQMASQLYLKKVQGTHPISYQDEIKHELTDLPLEDVSSEHLGYLEKALTQLCDNCRKLVNAVFYEGLNLKSYAEIQGKKPEAIRKQKQRCMEKLRKLLREASQA